MKKMTKKTLPVIFAALLGLLSSGALFAQSTVLPEGPGQEAAQNACIICHNASIITQQHLSPAAWTKEVDKMVRWNAPVLPADHDTLVRYLFDHFGPQPDAPLSYDLPAGPGRDTVQTACLSCHDAFPITSAHQSRAQWEKTVSQMEHWGEKLTPRERAIVVRYLSRNFSASTLSPASSIKGR
jgi:cytochrome c5